MRRLQQYVRSGADYVGQYAEGSFRGPVRQMVIGSGKYKLKKRHLCLQTKKPFLVRVTGLEPAQPCDHKNLNLARLPIPPHPRIILYGAPPDGGRAPLVRSGGLEPPRLPTRPSNVRVCRFRHDRILSLPYLGSEVRNTGHKHHYSGCEYVCQYSNFNYGFLFCFFCFILY